MRKDDNYSKMKSQKGPKISMFSHFSLPKSVKVAAILQLCIAFTLLLWFLLTPFLLPYYEARSDLLLIEASQGETKELELIDPVFATSLKERRSLQNSLFKNLSLPEKRSVLALDHEKRVLLKETFLEKSQRALLFLMKAPFISYLFLFLSIMTPIALLLLKPIGRAALLPLLITTFFFTLFHYNLIDSKKSALIPSEKELIDHPLKGSYIEQKNALEIAFQDYLIKNYLNETPSESAKIREAQLAKSEFFFLQKRVKELSKEVKNPFWSGFSPLTHIFLLIWELFFTLFAWSRTRRVKSQLGEYRAS